MRNIPWTTSEDEQLLKYWGEGITASQIGRKLNRSKQSVVGRIHRLRKRLGEKAVESRAPSNGSIIPALKPINPDGRTRTYGKPYQSTKVKEAAGLVAPKAGKKAKNIKIDSKEEIYDRASMRMPLMELGPHHCRWPVNDRDKDGEHLFCGHRVRPGDRYCQHHLDRSLQKRERDDA